MITKTKFFISVLIFCLIVSIIGIQSYISSLKITIKNQVKESENLKGQINELSNLYRNPITPTANPKALTYRKKEGDDYIIDCFDFENKKPNDLLINEINKKLEKNEKITYLCHNSALKQIVFIARKELNKGGFGRPPTIQFKINIYDETKKQVKLIDESSGNYLEGLCTKIISWTNKFNIVYQCGGGDGLLSSKVTFVTNHLTGEKGIIESCSISPEVSKCTQYCDNNNLCQKGFFCNLSTSSCIQNCDDGWQVCHGGWGDCQPFGPVRGCIN